MHLSLEIKVGWLAFNSKTIFRLYVVLDWNQNFILKLKISNNSIIGFQVALAYPFGFLEQLIDDFQDNFPRQYHLLVHYVQQEIEEVQGNPYG